MIECAGYIFSQLILRHVCNRANFRRAVVKQDVNMTPKAKGEIVQAFYHVLITLAGSSCLLG